MRIAASNDLITARLYELKQDKPFILEDNQKVYEILTIGSEVTKHEVGQIVFVKSITAGFNSDEPIFFIHESDILGVAQDV